MKGVYKIGEAALDRYGTMLELVENRLLYQFKVCFLADFFTFFLAKCDLIRLKNIPTKFQEALLGLYV